MVSIIFNGEEIIPHNPAEDFPEPMRSRLLDIQKKYQPFYTEPVQRLNVLMEELDEAKRQKDGIKINLLTGEKDALIDFILDVFHECGDKCQTLADNGV